MKKLLVITPHFPPFPRVGTIRRIENFVRYLPAFQWQPVILTMDWGYADRPGDATPTIYSTRNIALFSWNAYRSTEVSSSGPWRGAVASFLIRMARTFKNYLLLPDELILWTLWVLPKLRTIIRKEQPDAVLVNGPPFSTLLIGVLAKLIYRLPLICDVRDDWSENPLIEKKNRLLKAMEHRMEHWVVRHADKIVVVTPASHALWSNRYPDFRAKICLLPNGYNEEEFSEVNAFPFDDFALVHAGSLEAYRSPELLFRTLARFIERDAKIGFYQYGLTIREHKATAKKYGLDTIVYFEDIISGREAISRIKGASALVLIPTGNAPTAIPGKAYEYLRSGKPIILISPPNATTAFLKPFSQVHHVLPGDEIRLKEIIEQLVSRRESTSSVAASHELKRFERKELTGELAALLSSITEGTRQ